MYTLVITVLGEDAILIHQVMYREILRKQLASPRRRRSEIWEISTGVFRSDGTCYQGECRLLRRNHEFGVGSLREVY